VVVFPVFFKFCFSVQEIGWEEHLMCVELDMKPQLSQSSPHLPFYSHPVLVPLTHLTNFALYKFVCILAYVSRKQQWPSHAQTLCGSDILRKKSHFIFSFVKVSLVCGICSGGASINACMCMLFRPLSTLTDWSSRKLAGICASVPLLRSRTARMCHTQHSIWFYAM